MTTNKPKPKRQWECWAAIGKRSGAMMLFDTEEMALKYVGKAKDIRIKKVLVIEK